MRKLALIIGILLTRSAMGAPAYDTIRITADLELVRISDHTLIHISFSEMPGFGRVGSNGVVFYDAGEAVLFDTPADDALTQQLVEWLRDSLGLKFTAFVPNHWHADCMGGLGYLQRQGVPSYANRLTADIARSKGLPVPDHTFSDSLDLQLGKNRVQLYYPGAAHSADNIVVWIPSEEILFAGCMVKSLAASNLGNTVDGDTAAYPATIRKVMEKFGDAHIVVPGHGAAGGKELLEHTLRLAQK